MNINTEKRLAEIERRLDAIEARYKKRSRVPSLEAPIVSLLKLHGKPMSLQFLLDRLKASNVRVNGKRPYNTLSAHVSYLVRTKRLGRDEEGNVFLSALLETAKS